MHSLVDDETIYQISVGAGLNLTFRVGQKIKTGAGETEIVRIDRIDDALIHHGVILFTIFVKDSDGNPHVWRSFENMPVAPVYNIKT